MKTFNFLKTMLIACLLFVGVGVGSASTYKLEQVSSVAAGEKYVFVQDSHAFGSTVSSSALQTINNFNTTGLAGTEAYVWTLETATGGFYMKNVSLASNPYLNNASKTNVSFGSASSVWTFDFTNADAVLIQNTSNSSRFLGYTNATSYAYKAYATSNLSDYPHAIRVYKLVEEADGVTAPVFDVTAGTYTEEQLVLIDNYNSDYIYAYTTDGSNPAFDAELNVTNGTEYDNDEGIGITSSCTLKVIAVDEDGNASSITSAAYVIEASIANTQETAYTVAEAIALIDAGSAQLATTSVYVKGIISEIVTAWSNQYNNITYNISADGETTGNQFQLFRCATNGAEVGDNVIGRGILKKYNSTYEFEAGNTIVDIQKPGQKTITALAVSGNPTKTTYNVGDAFETAGLVVTATYDDESQEIIATGFDWEIDYGKTGEVANVAFVAGATSVDVMVYTDDDVMSEVYTVNGLTVNVPVTLTSIAVSGTPTKTSYYAGDAFETAGLVVTGTYSDSHQEVISEGIDWTIDPEELALGTTSVDVMAGVGTVVSDVYTVNGLTVTASPYRTATIATFSATSGDINTDIAYEAFKGGASTAPYLSDGSLRLYQNGGYITISAIPGLKIASVKITTTATYESTTVGYCVDDADAPTTGVTVAGSSDYTINGLNNSSVSIYCLGADKNTRLEISAIEVKYSGIAATVLKNIVLSGTYPTEFVRGAEFSHEGMTVTANYTDDSDADVTSSATFSGYNMYTIGEQTVTVSYTENAITKTAQYQITVNKAPFVPTPAAEGYETVDFTTIEPYKSLGNNGTADMTTYEGTSFSVAFAKKSGTNNAPKFYQNGNAVRAYVDNTLTITGAENITGVNVAWVEGYVDNAVSVTGLGTKTAVITLSKTCRFTAITVYYNNPSITLAATDGADYYATFSSDKAVEFEDATVYTVNVAAGVLSLNEVASKQVPANTGVLVKTAVTTAAYHYVAYAANLADNMLRPASEEMEESGFKFYKLAYDNYETQSGLGFYYGAADGAAFTAKEGGAYLAVPASAGAPIRYIIGSEHTATAIDALAGSATDVVKVVENGQVIIIKNGVRYNALGQMVK